jgi:hypothetical protein
VPSTVDREGHMSYREWLDAVFDLANTGALARQSRFVADARKMRPGDFFVQPGGPGHAVIILDLARSKDGRTRALLGQGFMPAQSFHVLRPDPTSAWFAIDLDAAGVKTPFWPEFTWSDLRRLD